MSRTTNRRQFLRKMTGYAAGAALGAWAAHELHAAKESPLYRISLAEWSLHKAIFDKKLDHLDFAKVAQEEFGIDGVEYVNQFFFEKAKDKEYLGEMKKRADDHGVKSLLIMIDREGRLGDPDEAKRTQAIENHYKWVEAAAFLGCHSIRVNAAVRQLRRTGRSCGGRPAAADRVRREAPAVRHRRESRRSLVERSVAG